MKIRPEIQQIIVSLNIAQEGRVNSWTIAKKVGHWDFSSHVYYEIRHYECGIGIVMRPGVFNILSSFTLRCGGILIHTNRTEKRQLNKVLRKIIKSYKMKKKAGSQNKQDLELYLASTCLISAEGLDK